MKKEMFNDYLSKEDQLLLDYPKIRNIPLDANLYKYLTFDNALLMLENTNIQFTAAKKLNDKKDCNISMINFDCLQTGKNDIDKKIDFMIINALYEKIEPEIDFFHICSFGTSFDNKALWEELYTGKDGVCIELNYSKVVCKLINLGKKIVAFNVNYLPSTKKLIPFQLYRNGGDDRNLFFYLLFHNKTKKEWAVEQEARITLIEKSDDDYIRITLDNNCFSKIYLSKKCTENQLKSIKNIIKKKGLTIEIVRL